MANNNILNLIVHTFPLAMFVLLLFSFYNIKHTGNIFNAYTIAIFVLFLPTAIAATLYYNSTIIPAFTNFTLFGAGLLATATLTILIYNTIVYYASTVKSAAYFVLILIAVLFGLTLFFILLSYAFSNEAIMAMIEATFSIPSLIAKFLQDFLDQFPHAPSAFVILFILEVILVLVIALIPFLIAQNPPVYSSLQFNGVYLLQKDPLNLTTKNEAVLANSHQLSVVDDPTAAKNPYQKTYTISLWVYMNPSEAAQNPRETTLFYYGHKELAANGTDWQVANPKPRITYIYDPVQRKDMYYVYLHETEPTKPTYKFHIPNQKWNHFVFVFQSDHVDFYINGHLEKSFPLSVDLGITQTYTDNDQIVVGDLHNASYGSVANVIYYDYPMTQNQVVDAWNKQQYWVNGSLYVPYSGVN